MVLLEEDEEVVLGVEEVESEEVDASLFVDFSLFAEPSGVDGFDPFA